MGKFDLQIDGKLKSLTAGDASWYYGGDGIAWPDLATARIKVPETIRPNQTVGVLVEGKVIEYIWHPNDISDEGLVLKNPTEEVIIEKDVFDTRELAMVKPLLNSKSFVVDKEEGFNGVYKYDSTKENGYSLIFLFGAIDSENNPEPVRTEINGGDSTSESDGIINGGNSTSESDGIINGGDSTNTSD